MKFNDLTKLLEQDESIFQPRKMEDRKTRYIQQIQKQIQDYINNGSKGNLNLFRTPIQTLPAGLKVGGNLSLSRTQIKTLPAGLKVGGNLSLTNTQIKTLPDGLEVGGDLYLYDTPIQTLPDGLEVGGDLWLLKTPIAKQYDRQQLKQMYPGVKGHINI
jgi:hypothetical protein